MIGLDYSLAEGTYLVKLARRAVETFLAERRILEEDPPTPKLRERSGVFVTINTYPEGALRGCIGYPEPILPLHLATIRAALAAAFNDPRFPPLSGNELDSVTFEVSILTVPERVDLLINDRSELPSLIKVGLHGLVISRGEFSGLLLPQVAVEYSWDSKEFLDQTCIKAGLEPGCWLQEGTAVFRFSAIIFREVAPRGKVVREELG